MFRAENRIVSISSTVGAVDTLTACLVWKSSSSGNASAADRLTAGKLERVHPRLDRSKRETITAATTQQAHSCRRGLQRRLRHGWCYTRALLSAACTRYCRLTTSNGSSQTTPRAHQSHTHNSSPPRFTLVAPILTHHRSLARLPPLVFPRSAVGRLLAYCCNCPRCKRG